MKKVLRILSGFLCVILGLACLASCGSISEKNVPDTSASRESITVDLGAGKDWVNGLFSEGTVKNEAGSIVKRSYGGGDTNGFKYKGEAMLDAPMEADWAAGAVLEGDCEIRPGGDIIPGAGWQNNISAGTLTAGKTDDNVRYTEFLDALKKLTCSDRGLYADHRITVTVPGVSNAKVALANEQGNVMAMARTNVLGVAYLYYNLKGEQYVPYVIGVSKDDSFAEYTLSEDILSEEEPEVTVELPGVQSEEIKLDLLIMLDTTGSMGDELDYIQAELQDMISRIAKNGQVTDIRISVNFYRDHGDEYTVKYYEFTEDVQECVNYIAAQSANRGGDYPEAVDEALLNGVEGHAWRDDAVKVMFMVLDAPAHSEEERQGVNDNMKKAVLSAASKGVRIVPVVASGADDDLECSMRKAAAVTGGKYLFLTDHSGIGMGHKDPVEVDSDVYPLNDLMVDVVLEYVDANHQPLQGSSSDKNEQQ